LTAAGTRSTLSGLDTHPPELLEVRLWRAAPPERRWAIALALARASGRELLAHLAEAEPRRFRASGPRLVHRRTGLRLCIVAAPRPFLLSEDVLTHGDLGRWGLVAPREVLVTDVDDDMMPAYLGGELELGAMRLPRDGEWEHAARAGTTSRFWWGDAIPSAPPALEHPLGLARIGWYDELTSDGRVRGGAARHWPWPAGSEAWRLLCSDASRAAVPGELLTLRPVLSI